MIKFVLPILFLAFGGYAQDEVPKKYLIDVQLEECLLKSEGQTTAGMIECTVKSVEAWDEELNKHYKLLMTELNPTQKELLKKAQRDWITYRDNEKAFLREFYGKKDGTMWPVFAASRLNEVVKARALELIEYYDILVNY